MTGWTVSQNIKMTNKKTKVNESGFRPLLCTYRLNWARRTSWGWWDEWDGTALQTQDSKFKPWSSEAEHPTSRSRRLPTIRVDGEETFFFYETAETGKRTSNSSVNGPRVSKRQPYYNTHFWNGRMCVIIVTLFISVRKIIINCCFVSITTGQLTWIM